VSSSAGNGYRDLRPAADVLQTMLHVKAFRTLLALAAGTLLLIPAAAPAKPRQQAPCANADLMPAAGNLAAVRAAVLCLHNRERAAHGLPSLRESLKLRHAAEGHSSHMVTARFFAHTSRSGGDMVDRVLGTGYARNQGWSLGENIAWGTGDLATAAEIERAWMHSPEHKANILRRQFREIGIGIAVGAPVADAGDMDGATYTADFGARR
jgi:uncharacterized protein YkwD